MVDIGTLNWVGDKGGEYIFGKFHEGAFLSSSKKISQFQWVSASLGFQGGSDPD